MSTPRPPALSKVAYIAGPMSGYPQFNFPAFMAAAAEFRRLGWDVRNPAENDQEHGLDTTNFTGSEKLADHGFSLPDALAWDLDQVMHADAVVLLPGWERSTGANLEVHTARVCGVTFIPWRDAVHPDDRPATSAAKPGGEVLVTAETGGAKGSKSARFDLIPTDAMWELAEHFGFGSSKYPPVNGVDNWRNGYPWSLSYAAALRHLTLSLAGQDGDAETGHNHLIAVAWHCLTLVHQMNRADMRAAFDDRQDPRTSGEGMAYLSATA